MGAVVVVIWYLLFKKPVMKTYKQTSEIFDYARLFHTKMKEFYEALYERTDNQRLKMLLEYLSRHEQHREETLAVYEKEASHKIMDTWFQYVPKRSALDFSLDFCKNTEINSDMSVDDLVCCTLQLNNFLVEFYKGLIEEAKIEEIKDVFSCLLKRLEQEERNLVRDALRLNEI